MGPRHARKKPAYETTKFTVDQRASCSRSILPASSPGSIRDNLSRRTHSDYHKRTITGLASEKTSTRNDQSFRGLVSAKLYDQASAMKPKPKISVKNYMSDKIEETVGFIHWLDDFTSAVSEWGR